MNTTIDVQNLSRIFHLPDPSAGFFRRLLGSSKAFQAIDDITLQINSGERVALVGENGSGKSTLIKLLCGIITPTNGTVTVLGHDMAKRNRRVYQDIGVMFGQKTLLFNDLSVRDGLELYRVIYNLSNDTFRTAIEELNDLLNFHELLPRPVRKLSLGQRMRCEIVAALLHRPKVVFLDEPSIGLDATTRNGLKRLIKTWLPNDSSLVLVSHDSYLADDMCSRVIELADGCISKDLDAELIWQLGRYLRLEIQFDGAPPQLGTRHIRSQTESSVTLDVPATEEAKVREAAWRTAHITSIEVSPTPIQALLSELERRKHDAVA